MCPQSSEVERLQKRFQDAQHAIVDCSREMMLARREMAEAESSLKLARVHRFVRNLRA